MRLIFALLLFFSSAIPSGAAIVDAKLIFFICSSADAAEEVARNMRDSIPGLTPLPAGCRWLYPTILPENIASIEEIVKTLPMDDGRYVIVARVIRNGFEDGYSAGYLELLAS